MKETDGTIVQISGHMYFVKMNMSCLQERLRDSSAFLHLHKYNAVELMEVTRRVTVTNLKSKITIPIRSILLLEEAMFYVDYVCRKALKDQPGFQSVPVSELMEEMLATYEDEPEVEDYFDKLD